MGQTILAVINLLFQSYNVNSEAIEQEKKVQECLMEKKCKYVKNKSTNTFSIVKIEGQEEIDYYKAKTPCLTTKTCKAYIDDYQVKIIPDESVQECYCNETCYIDSNDGAVKPKRKYGTSHYLQFPSFECKKSQK